LDASKLYESELADDTRVELIKDKAKVSDMETDDFEEITHSPEFSTGEWVKNLASFKHFPNYWTFFENLSTLRAIDLNNKQANLLSNYTTWIIKENDKSKRIFKSFFRD
ncbi:MAG: hypothetical protein Q9M75_07645, partial [Ghiorsea sp.]|nr:hypothetical protein [Ghiorsea sp.]